MTNPKDPRSLDHVDRLLLRGLIANGRMSSHALAKAASIAESTAHARVAALVDSGVVRGIHADVDPAALGRPIQALIQVQLNASARPLLREEAARLAHSAGVIEVFFLAGARDLLIRVAVADAAELRDFVMNELSRHREIALTETSLVLEHLRGDLLRPQL